MTEKEEYYIYFLECINSLNSSWILLKKISEEHNNKLSGAAFRFALIEYCKPYTNSMGIVKKRNTLDKRYIPPFI